MTGADISGSRAVFLVARRELRTRVRTRGFVLSTLAMLLAVAGYLGLMTVFTDDDPSTVGLAPQHAALVGPLSAAAAERGERIEIREVTGRDAAQAQLRDSELDAWVTGSPDTLEVLVREDLDTGLRTALVDVAATRVVNAQLARAGLDPQQVQQQAAAAGVQVTSLEPVDPQRGERLVLSFAVSFLLYLALILYGTYVAQGVVEEKSSRVVELLLCTVRPWQLMFGKLIGIGLFGLSCPQRPCCSRRVSPTRDSPRPARSSAAGSRSPAVPSAPLTATPWSAPPRSTESLANRRPRPGSTRRCSSSSACARRHTSSTSPSWPCSSSP